MAFLCKVRDRSIIENESEYYEYQTNCNKFYIIIQMTIIIFSDRCNMTCEYYINQPMSMCERKMNMNIAKSPQLINSLDRNKNHPLIRNYSHLPFNN